MKKTLLFISLFASAIVLRAQIDVLYQGNVVNDTIVIYEQSPNEESYLYFNCKNNSSSALTARITAETVYGTEDIHVMSICVPGSCVPGTVSGDFELAPNAEAECDAWIEIISPVPGARRWRRNICEKSGTHWWLPGIAAASERST